MNKILRVIVPFKKRLGLSENRINKKSSLSMRFIAIYRILTKRNFILLNFTITGEPGEEIRKIESIYRTDYDKEKELVTLKAAYLIKERNKS